MYVRVTKHPTNGHTFVKIDTPGDEDNGSWRGIGGYQCTPCIHFLRSGVINKHAKPTTMAMIAIVWNTSV